MNNICIIGAGAMGLLWSSQLCIKNNVFLLCKKEQFAKGLSEKHLKVILNETFEKFPFNNLNNSQLEISNQNEQLKSITLITLSNLHLLPKDTIFFNCVKAFDLEESLKTISPFLSRSTPVVLTQNGLNIVFDAEGVLNRKAPLIRLLSETGSKKIETFTIKTGGKLKASITCYPEDTNHKLLLKNILLETDCQISEPESIALAEWQKALINLTVNPICAVKDVKNGSIIDEPLLNSDAKNIIDEVKKVALRDGFDLSATSYQDIMNRIENSRDNICSTLSDIRNGAKHSELPYILNRFLKIAESHNIETPILKKYSILLGNLLV